MEIDKRLYDEINEYCKLNGLKTRDFIHKILKEGFMKEKYGESPFIKVQMTKTAEAEACEKIKDLIENQVSVPPEIMEIVDEHFFEMLDEQKKEKEQVTGEQLNIAVGVYEKTLGSEMAGISPTNNTGVIEIPKPKKKRKLN